MKFGANTQILDTAWFTQEDLPLIDKVAALGFEMIELGYASAEPPFNIVDVKSRLRAAGLTPGVCSFLSAEHDIASPDAATRARGVAYMQAFIATVAELGGEILRVRSMRNCSAPATCRRTSGRASGNGRSPR